MTSNIGQDILLADSNGKKDDDSGKVSKEAKEQVIDTMKAFYPPEFINRVDDVVVFNRLSKSSLRHIVDLRIDEIQDRLVDRRIQLQLTDEAKEWLTNNGYEPMYGARPLNRLIKRTILNPMSVLLLKGEIADNSLVEVFVVDDKLEVKGTKKPKDPELEKSSD
ncbi:unnamed protein product [[Candida] boidinii]|nr:unnamed protein product [[Candida] boidinii]